MTGNISDIFARLSVTRDRYPYVRNMVAGLLLACVCGCASTKLEPLTSQTEPGLLAKDEQALWTTAGRLEREIADHIEPSATRTQAEQYLDGVLGKLTPDFRDARVRVRIRILPDSNPNAFILPNGAMYVNSGLLALLENEAQLATILGHEFCHFQNRHSYRERIQERNEIARGVLVGATLAVLSGTPEAVQSVAEVWRISSISGYSRNLESEADHASLLAMMKAGYQPEEAVRAFERLQTVSQEEEDEKQQRFATHPKLDDRIASYRKCLQQPEAQACAPGREVAAAAYHERTFDVVLDNAELNLDEDHYDMAGANIKRCLKLKPDCARAHFLRGEFLRRGPGTEENVWQRALECYDRSIQCDPNFGPAYREAGLLHRQLGDRARAAEALRKYQGFAADAADAPLVKSYLEKLADASEVTPGPYRAPLVTKEDFREKAKTVGIMPVVVPEGISNPEKRQAEFEATLTEQLEQAGFEVVPSSVYRALYEATRKTMGAVYDPNTGEQLEERHDTVVEYAQREYMAAYKIDLLAYPALVTVAARWSANRAAWHGVQEASTGKEGFWGAMMAPSAYGTMSALSFRLVLANAYGDVCLVSYGGIQLLSRVAGRGFTSVPAHELLVDPAKNARSVEIACKALKERTR
jgi:tetratricopeptide (TPR) repeat protein